MLHLKLDTFSKKKSIIFELISTILIIIALILLIVQGFDNDKFKNNKNREIKTEKFLYNIFSQEIHSNLNKNIFFGNAPSYYDYYSTSLRADIMINSNFDCRDVKDAELNEDICQNKIINNKICCKAECCSRNNGGKVFCTDYNFQLNSPNINNYKVISYDREEYYDDPRRRFCTYYNKYYDFDIYNFNNQNINIMKVYYNYEDLLLNRVENTCINYTKCHEYYIDCGIIDTKNRHLYVMSGTMCPINNIKYENSKIVIENIYDNYNNTVNYNYIILKNILSEITPTLHEKSYFDYNYYYYYYYNYLYDDDNSILNEEITIKDLNKLLKKRKNIYNKMPSFQLSLNNYKIESGINNDPKFNWYTTNYIGFKSANDYLRFKKYFPENDSNNLIKIGKKIYPCIKHIIVSFPLLFIFLLYILILFLSYFEKIRIGGKKFKILFIIRLVLLICMLILEIIFYVLFMNEFEEIKINMDDNFEEILDLYNKRRFQLLYLLSIIFQSSAFIPIFIFFLINCESSKSNNPSINNNINNDINNNNINNEINNGLNSRNFERNRHEISSSSRHLLDKNKSKNNNNDNFINNNEINQNKGKGQIIPFENQNNISINKKKTINDKNNNNNLISNESKKSNELLINNKDEEDIKESKNINIIYNERNNNKNKKTDLKEENYEFNIKITNNSKNEYEKLGLNKKKNMNKTFEHLKNKNKTYTFLRYEGIEKSSQNITIKRKLTDPKKDNKNNKTTLGSESTDILNKYNKFKNKSNKDSNNNNLFDEET